MLLPTEKQFIRAMKSLKKAPSITLELTPIQAFCLLANIQLALRHPQNTGPGSEIAKSIANVIEENLPNNPVIREIARAGWNPEHDITIEDTPNED